MFRNIEGEVATPPVNGLDSSSFIEMIMWFGHGIV
jgi:hypothetical protein